MIHDLTGQMIGHYQIIRPIEQGGMATVYLARDIHLQRQVAIKVFQFEEGARETQEFFYRFTREAQVVARLDHPNIVLVHDYGEQDRLAYLVMPYFSNGSLKQLLNKRSRLSIPESLHFILQLLNALQYAHNRGLIHRDIKPGNILFKNDQTPVLADFGLVKENITDDTGDITAIGLSSKRQHPLTNGALMGTPYYMAPEQIRGQVQRQSDIYSIGLVLYEMLTGRLPFVDDKQGGLLTILLKQTNDPPQPITELNPDIPSQLGEAIMRALEKDAGQRYQSPTEFSEALRISAPQYIGTSLEIEEHFHLNEAEYKNDPSPNDTSPLPTIELQRTPVSDENPSMQPSNTLIVNKTPLPLQKQVIPHKRRLSYLLYGALAAILLVVLGFSSPLLLSLLHHPVSGVQPPVATQSNQSIIPPPVTQTNCPPTGQARAAVLGPGALSKGHNAVVYASSFHDDAGGEHGSLMIYDTMTSKTHTIITVPGLLFGEQLSADGQWVIFSTSGVNPTVSRIQMVRIDGTELQTLYCSPSTLAYLLASPNLQPSQGWHLYLSEYITDQSSTMIVLNLLTGKVQHLTANSSYRPIAWQDDQQLYMREDNTHGAYDPSTQSGLALLTIHDTETSKIANIWTRKTIPTFCTDVAFSTDFSTLFTSHCNGQGSTNSSGDASVTSEAPSYIEHTALATDLPDEDKSTTFYTSSALAITQIRTITSTKLIFLVENGDQYGGQNGLWKINTNGTGVQRLSTEKTDPTFFNRYSQYPWSNVSTDGSSYYAIKTASTLATGADQLFVGSLSDGQPKVIAADGVGGINKNSMLEVAGWTTI